MTSSPAIVVVSKFVSSDTAKELNLKFDDYVGYVDREEAKEVEPDDFDISEMSDERLYNLYLDYMNDNEKQGQLFSIDHDYLDEEATEIMKEVFKKSQKNESPMWQDVISFDNEWLAEQGIYDSETHWLDEKKIKSVVRDAFGSMLKAEKMDQSAAWTGAIHYNTKNIHVHIATVEPSPTREKVHFFDEDKGGMVEQYRAKRKQKSIDNIRSTIAGKILNRNAEYEKIDDIIKGTINEKKHGVIDLSEDRRTSKLFNLAIAKMPDDMRQWRYGYESINDARPFIDEMVDIYLETYHKEDVAELNMILDKDVGVNKRLYGEDSNAENTKQNKLYKGKDSLKYKMGNAVLDEMRAYKMNERVSGKQFQQDNPRTQNKKHSFNNWRRGSGFQFALNRFNYAMRKKFNDHQKDKNIAEFDRMMDRQE